MEWALTGSASRISRWHEEKDSLLVWKMSCSSLCAPACGVAAPAPLADSYNEPCVRQCPDSTVVIQPPASVVTFPGPILSSFPQNAVVGSAGVPAVGSGLGGTFGRSAGFGGYGGLGGYGGSYGLGALGAMEALAAVDTVACAEATGISAAAVGPAKHSSASVCG
uniref:Keratin n=1 Tax=Meleagris gallopavo TaxID=9103 RepID=A0A803YBB8_MELGA